MMNVRRLVRGSPMRKALLGRNPVQAVFDIAVHTSPL